VRLRPNLSVAAGLADMQRAADTGPSACAPDQSAAGDAVSVLQVQHRAEIVNDRSTGATPVVPAAGLAVGAIAALGLTLHSSVRQRRRDLALLKTLGFTKRQLAAVVAWQSSVAAIIGVCVGLPLGIVAGRSLWILFARDIDAVPQPTTVAPVRGRGCARPGEHRGGCPRASCGPNAGIARVALRVATP
jgi:hypothetical protein